MTRVQRIHKQLTKRWPLLCRRDLAFVANIMWGWTHNQGSPGGSAWIYGKHVRNWLRRTENLKQLRAHLTPQETGQIGQQPGRPRRWRWP
jgi:hypothetical protein